jgi:hypothetical protein
MINVRKGTFETNSSSTHSLVVLKIGVEGYIPLAKHIKIEWIDTNDYYVLDTLEEKLSYLVSHIANKVKYSCNTYEELLEEVEDNFEYKEIKEYILKTFDKEIRFPANKDGIYDDVEYITEINHQLVPWGSGAPVDEVLDELIEYRTDKDENRLYNKETECDLSFEQKLDIYFKDGTYIAFGRD